MSTPATDHIQTVLRSLAEPVPSWYGQPGLADRALARAAQRRRRTSALTVAGAALAAALVVLTVVLVPRNDPAPATPAATGVFGQPRQNVLLIGSDAAPDRAGVRPDTIILASIDTRTGATVMFGLPRNLERVPFAAGTPGAKAWPRGYSCPQHACLLNAVWQWASTSGYGGHRNPGLAATTDAVQGITGLRVDQSVVVTMKGLQELVDAVGGVTITVRERLPIGGSANNRTPSEWIEPGRQHLDGYHALWYARSRWSTSDYDRMARQQCVLKSLVAQVSTGRLISAYPRIAAALKGNLQMSIPAGDLVQWGELVTKIRDGGVVMLPVRPQSPAAPDYNAIHDAIRSAIGQASATASPASRASAIPSSRRSC